MSTHSAVTTLDEMASEVAQHCIRCGRSAAQIEFRSPMALKCVECDAAKVADRKDYHRVYHKARGRAMQRLIDMQPDLFRTLLAEERDKVEREEAEEAAAKPKKKRA